MMFDAYFDGLQFLQNAVTIITESLFDDLYCVLCVCDDNM